MSKQIGFRFDYEQGAASNLRICDVMQEVQRDAVPGMTTRQKLLL